MRAATASESAQPPPSARDRLRVASACGGRLLLHLSETDLMVQAAASKIRKVGWRYDRLA